MTLAVLIALWLLASAGLWRNGSAHPRSESRVLCHVRALPAVYDWEREQ